MARRRRAGGPHRPAAPAVPCEMDRVGTARSRHRRRGGVLRPRPGARAARRTGAGRPLHPSGLRHSAHARRARRVGPLRRVPSTCHPRLRGRLAGATRPRAGRASFGAVLPCRRRAGTRRRCACARPDRAATASHPSPRTCACIVSPVPTRVRPASFDLGGRGRAEIVSRSGSPRDPGGGVGAVVCERRCETSPRSRSLPAPAPPRGRTPARTRPGSPPGPILDRTACRGRDRAGAA